MRRRLFTWAAGISWLLCAAVCVLWVRGRTGSDEAAWTYDRWLPDGSAASTQVYLTSDRRLWLLALRGHVGPPDGSLAWGYYVNADGSGGRPRLTFRHERYDPMQVLFFGRGGDGTSGVGPLRWQGSRRSKATDGDDHRGLRVGVSHWLAALVLLVPPVLWLRRARQARRARNVGLCPACGYDLRATPGRCPECGTVAKGAA